MTIGNDNSQITLDNETLLNKKQAVEFLGIPEKHFKNYSEFSCEIKREKIRGRWYFKKEDLLEWKKMKDERTVDLSLKEYEECFEFAIKMAYSSKGSHGTGIRGARSEVQMSDDFIMGILAELGIKKFLEDKFGTVIELDREVHPDHITAQDFVGIHENGTVREVKIGVAVKSSKIKSCYNVIDPLEYENGQRKSDAYIFARVDLPSDHLFRILRSHSFFKKVKDFLDSSEGFRKIEPLEKVPIWICGFNYHGEFDKSKEIPGQDFGDWRYVKSVSGMHNTDQDWRQLISRL